MPLRAFPNPAVCSFTFSGPPDEINSFSLFDLQGKKVSHPVEIKERNPYHVFVDLKDLPEGIYLLQIPNQTLKVRKE